MNKHLQKALIILVAGSLLVIASWSAWQVFTLSSKRAEIKADYTTLNNITNGLLSVNAWRDHLIKVVTNRIDDFEFSRAQEDTLKAEIEVVLHALVNKADSIVDKKQKTVGGKLKKMVVKAFVNEEKIHAQVPAFAETIVNELKKDKNKQKLKFLIKSKLQDFGSLTYDSINDVARGELLLEKYGVSDLLAFNQQSQMGLMKLQNENYFYTTIIVCIMIFFTSLWWLLRNQHATHTPFFTICVLLALVMLAVGITAPMIEIDARIKEMSFLLIGEKITFHDQVIFFQSKSIVDVVRILIETRKFDSSMVGILILIFSIVFPICKLLSTKVYLLGNEKWKRNRLINFFAFKSGKWSMADVNVVAIFMAYIGFKGILDSQMESINIKSESLASISTNDTSLQPGFVLFLAYVIFGLILSVVLKKITISKLDKTITPSETCIE